jgi:hypothetical protein
LGGLAIFVITVENSWKFVLMCSCIVFRHEEVDNITDLDVYAVIDGMNTCKVRYLARHMRWKLYGWAIP